MDRELALRAHIRTHLLEYCLEHLTTNYITYTENAVSAVNMLSLCLVYESDTSVASISKP